ncbi:hypothetical protein HPB47_013116 [Ixodes persulcatus]|uniref:Uncharacterized protein n=1 Tax=Ixodes persulcatus TaxID=34615 RepID=A0AC60NRL4_IXOPE|nr:hypothetical protein HPB47_013116 [Ixodes persulcatus]
MRQPFWPVYVFCDPYGPDYYGEYGRPSRYPAFSAQSRALTSFLRRAPRARMEPMERQRRSILATPATEDVAEQKNESGDHDVRIREITEDMEKVAVHQGPATSPLAGANKSVDVPPKDEHQRTTVAAATSQSDVAEQTDQWLYQDNQGRVHGPFSGSRMAAWFVAGNLMVSLPIKRTCDAEFQTLGQVMKAWGRVPFQSDGSHLGGGPFLPPMLPVPLLQRDLWSASGTSCSPTQQPSSAREDVHEMGSKDQPPLTSFEHENTKSPDMRPDLEEGRVSSVSNPTLMVSAFQPIQPASLGVRNLSANIHDDSQKAAVLGSNREPLEGACGGYAMVQQQPEDCDSFKKTDLKLQQSVSDLVLSGVVAAETGTKNLFSFSAISKDASSIDQQFTKLKNFVSEASEPFKSELSFVLFPIFVHLYLELVSNGQKSLAQKFHGRHRGMFQSSDQFRVVVDVLPNISSASDVPSHPQIKEFKENKYSVKLSSDTLEYVLSFLKDNDNLILLQIFNLHVDIDVHVHHEKVNGDGSQGAPLLQVPSAKGDAKQTTHPAEQGHNKEALASLRQIMKKVREGPPCIPSICLYTLAHGTSGLCSAAEAEDDSLLACGFEDSSVRLWSLLPRPLASQPAEVDVRRIRLYCDADADADKGDDAARTRWVAVRAWDLKTHRNVAIYRGHSYPVWALDVGPLGIYFATASKDNTARIWTPERTFPLRILAGHNMDVDCVKFHPNCNYLATGSSDRCLRLWSVQEGRVVRTLPSHRGTIFALAFSPDGQLLASAGEDRRIKVWDLGSSSLLKELRGHTDAVYDLSFNRDGSLLASGGAEPLVRLWDLRRSTAPSASDTDSHTSPEHLASFPTATSALHMVRYASHNLLTLVGSAPAASSAPRSSSSSSS